MTPFAELMNWCAEDANRGRGVPPLPSELVENVRHTGRLSVMTFCDQFARHIAHEYHVGSLDFSVADFSINALHVFVSNTYDVRLPSYSWEVFMAFDDGEHYHRDDPEGTDPEDKYTKPQIASLVIRDSILG